MSERRRVGVHGGLLRGLQLGRAELAGDRASYHVCQPAPPSVAAHPATIAARSASVRGSAVTVSLTS